MTTIYLIRHSKPQDIDYNNNDSFQIQNEKQHLSKEGIELTLNKLNIQELKILMLYIHLIIQEQ